jgi:hypothetical protein
MKPDFSIWSEDGCNEKTKESENAAQETEHFISGLELDLDRSLVEYVF